MADTQIGSGVNSGAALFDATGRKLPQHNAPQVTGVRGAARPLSDGMLPPPPGANLATACFELRNGPIVIKIQVTVDLYTPNSGGNTFEVLDGSLSGDIFTRVGTSWKVTSGSFGAYIVDGKFAGSLSFTGVAHGVGPGIGDDAQQITIFATAYRVPGVWYGQYGFNYLGDGALSYYHATLFKGWHACS
jgi:hypothetical protein